MPPYGPSFFHIKKHTTYALWGILLLDVYKQVVDGEKEEEVQRQETELNIAIPQVLLFEDRLCNFYHILLLCVLPFYLNFFVCIGSCFDHKKNVKEHFISLL